MFVLIFVELEMFRLAGCLYAPVALQFEVFLSAIQFLYVIVDKLCDIFIICTTKCYGFVDLHLFLKLVVFFACIGVGERKVILFIMLYYWHQNLVFLTYMLSNWSSSIPFVFLHDQVNAECLAIHLKVQTMLILSMHENENIQKISPL